MTNISRRGILGEFGESSQEQASFVENGGRARFLSLESPRKKYKKFLKKSKKGVQSLDLSEAKPYNKQATLKKCRLFARAFGGSGRVL